MGLYLYRPTRTKKVFYAKNINMIFSFDSLYKIAKKMLGAELDEGDIIICDSENKTKRKAMQITKRGYVILYIRLHKGEEPFEELSSHNGQLRALPGPLF